MSILTRPPQKRENPVKLLSPFPFLEITWRDEGREGGGRERERETERVDRK